MNMNQIKRLPPTVTNKIAAGEVIDRPASVVKELVENALDAGGRHIEIHIIKGGKEKILIIDDGFGIGIEDAAIAFERFSTSKIDSFEDLEHLSTFGFRGEALASIAAVSIIELKTKTADVDEGTFMRIEGGIVVNSKEISWNKGTSIAVNNIFYNTPARRKFQKNALSETRQTYRVFRSYALANPDVAFKLNNNDKLVWNLQQSELSTRISDLFDANIQQYLVEVDGHSDLFSLHGYISIPELTRSTRNDQYLFLNQRYIKNRSIEHAVYQGYGETLSHSHGHPIYVLMLTVPPDRFDVNIHPTKFEARFQDEREIHRLVANSVKNTLGFTGTGVMKPLTTTYHNASISGSGPMPQNKADMQESAAIPFINNLFMSTKVSAKEPLEFTQSPQINIVASKVGDDSKEIHIDPEKVWQVHQCFIFSQVKNGLVIIDQHTAHERILYEKALRMLNEGEKPSQQLLFPQTVQFNKDEMIVLTELISLLEKLGFDIRLFGSDTAVIESVPLNIKMGREVESLQKILDEYQKDEYKDMDIHERVAQSFACRSAIMKGDKLTPEEMYKLIDDLFATQFPYYCPHGRPTIVDLSLKELNSRFFR